MLETVKDSSGQMSSMRVVFILVALIIFGVWGYISVETKMLTPIPDDIQVVLAAIFGGKIFQTAIGK